LALMTTTPSSSGNSASNGSKIFDHLLPLSGEARFSSTQASPTVCPVMPEPAPIQMLVRLHGWSRWLLERRRRRLSQLVDRIIRLAYAARIPAEADIHPSVHFSHNALAVVVTKEAKIAARCQIGVHVLLGSRWPVPGGPRLEEEVIVHAGAKIIGPISIGRGSVIGAGSVVVADVPPHSLVVGVPGVVKKTGIRIGDYLQPATDADT
jgi:serine O-acetyltransferase